MIEHEAEDGREGRTGRRTLLRNVALAASGLTFSGGRVVADDKPSGIQSPTSTTTPTQTVSFAASDCDSPTSLSPSDVEQGGTLSKGCYRAEKTLGVESGTLTLEPGVQIEFAKNDGLKIESEGRLRANGTGSSPVVLTGTKESRGHWKGLFFRGSRSSDNRLEKTLIQYAGGGSWNPNWENGGIVMKNGSVVALNGVLVRENGRAGVVVRSANDQLSVSNTRFEANEYPAWTHANAVGAFTPDNVFQGNDKSAIRIGVDGADTVQTNQTWQNPGVPFRVTKHVQLEAPVTVTDGAKFVFDQKKGLDVRKGGRLTVKGTGDAPVTFTGREDLRGSWKGIRFNTSKAVANVMEHAVVEFAGDSAWNPNHRPAGIFLHGDHVACVIRDSRIRGNASVGLIATGSKATLALRNNLFQQNDAPLLLQANLVGGITEDNAFDRNTEEYVSLDDPGFGGAWTTVTDPASWPALDAPYRPNIHVAVEAPLEVSPGATFEFEQDAGMRIRGDGRLTADAAEGKTITFRGTEDITGFWRGLYFVNSLSRDNVLKNTVIENGGSSQWGGGPAPRVANLFLRGGDNAAAVVISDSILRGSGKFGIGIGDGKARVMDCSGVTFKNNAGLDTYNIEADSLVSSCQ